MKDDSDGCAWRHGRQQRTILTTRDARVTELPSGRSISCPCITFMASFKPVAQAHADRHTRAQWGLADRVDRMPRSWAA
jgi:hypothetical protein